MAEQHDRDDTTELDEQHDPTEREPDQQADDERQEPEQEAEQEAEQEQEQSDQQETFPREYVEQLRTKSSRYRHRMKEAESKADQLSRELFRARVALTGKLADPDDMRYRPSLMDRDGALEQAVDELVQRKPHLAARRVRGNVGQHDRGTDDQGESLAAILRRNA
jgi:hypothetical protein